MSDSQSVPLAAWYVDGLWAPPLHCDSRWCCGWVYWTKKGEWKDQASIGRPWSYVPKKRSLVHHSLNNCSFERPKYRLPATLLYARLRHSGDLSRFYHTTAPPAGRLGAREPWHDKRTALQLFNARL